MKSGVYKIINKLNGKFYLGVTKDFKSRFRHHKSDLRLNKHHSIILQRAVNKYGIDNFKFEIFIKSPIEELYKLEQTLLTTEKPEYNVRVNSDYYINRNKRKLSETHIQSIKNSWSEERRTRNGKIVRKRKLGTHLEQNSKDKIGIANSKLTNVEVKEIREHIKKKIYKGKEIAALYKVTPQTISQIKNNKIYERVD